MDIGYSLPTLCSEVENVDVCQKALLFSAPTDPDVFLLAVKETRRNWFEFSLQKKNAEFEFKEKSNINSFPVKFI